MSKQITKDMLNRRIAEAEKLLAESHKREEVLHEQMYYKQIEGRCNLYDEIHSLILRIIEQGGEVCIKVPSNIRGEE